MSFDPKAYAVRHWGAVTAPGDPLVYIEVSAFAEAILWGKQAAGDKYGLIFGNQATEPERVVLAERFVGGEPSVEVAMERVGVVFWRHDSSVMLSVHQSMILSKIGYPSLAIVLDTNRRSWALYLHDLSRGYSRLSSISIYQKYGTAEGLDKTLSLLGQIPWAVVAVKTEPEPAGDAGYHLARMVHTSRKAFLWGGLAGLFLGAAAALIIATVWGGWQTPGEIDRWGFLTGKSAQEESTGGGSANEQARTQARLELERALAGNPDEILGFCTDVVSRDQCREALDRLRIAPQHSLSYNPEGVQVSTTVPGLPAYLFRIDTVDGKFRISGVTELTPPVELGIKTVPAENGKDKNSAEGEKKDTVKPAEDGKTTVEQTQKVGGKAVTP